MSEKFSKVNYVQKISCEGGATDKVKSNASYRSKANFDTPRSPRFNKGHLKIQRIIGILLIIANIIINIPILLRNVSNPLWALAFYSLWGSGTAFMALISSTIAMDTEGWFKFAFIMTEISYAVNVIVVIIFWTVLWPMTLSQAEMMDNEMEKAFLIWYQGLIHAIPMITTVLDLYMTDMALEKSHWWIAFLTMFPFYMICNWVGAMTMGGLNGKIGNIYGVEQWDTNIPLTIFLFFLLSCIQAAIFYGSAACIDKIWPKRVTEIYELNKNLLDDEK